MHYQPSASTSGIALSDSGSASDSAWPSELASGSELLSAIALGISTLFEDSLVCKSNYIE